MLTVYHFANILYRLILLDLAKPNKSNKLRPDRPSKRTARKQRGGASDRFVSVNRAERTGKLEISQPASDADINRAAAGGPKNWSVCSILTRLLQYFVDGELTR